MSSTINAGTSGLVLTGSTTTTLSLATNGTTRATIDASGNVGIGVSSLTIPLQIGKGGGGNPATSGTTQTYGIARIGSGGAAALDVGTYAAGQVWMQGVNVTNLASNFDLVLQPNGGNVGIGGTPSQKLSVIGGRTRLQANNETYSLQLEYGSGTGQYYMGATNSATPDLVFSNVFGSEAMRVTNTGNVGIGTASPGTKLTVSSATNAGISVTDGTVTTIMYNSTGGVGSIGTTSNHALNILSNNATRFTIGAAGQFGVGGANYGTAGQVLTSNGSGAAPSWQTVGGSSLKSQTFTSSGTFTVPTGITSVWVTMVGGGGSGGGGASNVQTAGGGAGAYTIKRAVSVTPGASVSVTVGGGGAGVLTNASQGNNGSASSFGSVSVSGGGGGNRVNGSTTPSAGTTGVGGANGGSPSNGVRLPPGSIGGIGGLFSSTNQVGGGAGGLFGDGTDGWYLGSSSSAGANTGAGSGGASDSGSGNYSTGNGGSGMVIVEWLG